MTERTADSGSAHWDWVPEHVPITGDHGVDFEGTTFDVRLKPMDRQAGGPFGKPQEFCLRGRDVMDGHVLGSSGELEPEFIEPSEETALTGVLIFDLRVHRDRARQARGRQLSWFVVDPENPLPYNDFLAGSDLKQRSGLVTSALEVQVGADGDRLIGSVGEMRSSTCLTLLPGEPLAGIPGNGTSVADDVAASLRAPNQPFGDELAKCLMNSRAASAKGLRKLVLGGQALSSNVIAAQDSSAKRSRYLTSLSRHRRPIRTYGSTCPTNYHVILLGLDSKSAKADRATCWTSWFVAQVRHKEAPERGSGKYRSGALIERCIDR